MPTPTGPYSIRVPDHGDAADLTVIVGNAVEDISDALTGIEGATLFARKTSDTSRTSETLTADPHLVVPVAGDAVYTFKVVAGFHGLGPGGTVPPEPNFKCDFSAPSGSALRWTYGSWDGESPEADHPDDPYTFPNTASRTELRINNRVAASAGTLTSFGLTLDGLLRTGETSGDLCFRWARIDSGGSASVVYEDSYLVAQRVA